LSDSGIYPPLQAGIRVEQKMVHVLSSYKEVMRMISMVWILFLQVMVVKETIKDNKQIADQQLTVDNHGFF